MAIGAQSCCITQIYQSTPIVTTTIDHVSFGALTMAGILGGGIGGYMQPGGILGGGGQSPPYANFREWMQANPDTVTALATGLLSGPTFRQSLANASAGYAQAAPMDRRRKAVNEWLKAGGPTDVQNPATAALFQSAPDLAEKYLAGKMAGPSQTDDMREYAFAKAQGYAGSFQDWMATGRKTADTSVQVQDFWDPEKGIPVKKQYDPATQTWKEIGMGRPPSGTSLEVGPDGTVRMSQGVGVTPDGHQKLGTAATNDIQKQMDDLTLQKQQVERIGQLYDPSFLTYWGKIKGGAASVLDKVGVAGPQDRDFLTKQTQFNQNVEQVFNLYRKDITGAAAAVAELDRLKKAVINTDQSPTEFKAALGEFARALERGLAIKTQLLSEGIPLGSPAFSAEFEKRFLGGQGGGGASPAAAGKPDPLGIR